MRGGLQADMFAFYLDFSVLVQHMKVIGLFTFIAGKDISLNLVLLHICGDLWLAYPRGGLLSFQSSSDVIFLNP